MVAPVQGSAMTNLPPAFKRLRTCYHHPAGVVGVALTSALRRKGWIEPVVLPGRAMGGYLVTQAGVAELTRLGVEMLTITPLMVHKACADYTERLPDGSRGVPHLGGALGAALTQWLLDYGLAERLQEPRNVYEKRALALTSAGRACLIGVGLIDKRTGAVGRSNPRR